MPQTREHILLARQVGVPYIVVALNKVGHGGRRGVAGVGGVGSAGVVVASTRTSRGTTCPVMRGSATCRRWSRSRRDASARSTGDRRVDVGGGRVHSDAGAGDRPAVPDADRGRVLRSAGRGTVVTGRDRAGPGEGGARRSRLWGSGRRASDGGDGGGDVQEAAGRRARRGTTSGLLVRGTEARTRWSAGMVVAKPKQHHAAHEVQGGRCTC